MPLPSMTTLCVGRLLVDLPVGATAIIDATYHYIESEKPVQIRDFDALERQLGERARTYQAIKMQRTADDDRFWLAAGDDPSNMYATTRLVAFESDPSEKQVLLAYHEDKTSVGVIIELHKIIESRDYIFQIKDVIGAYKYPERSKPLWISGLSFVALDEGVIPRNPGFCVQRGMFPGSGTTSVPESFTLVVTLPDHPDVSFTIDADAIDEPDNDEPSLRNRIDSELSILRENVPGHVSTMVRGSLNAAGQKGYQIGINMPFADNPKLRARKFVWSADGVPKDVTRPFLEVEMMIQPNEDGVSTIHDDGTAKKLWDQLLGGIRIRPGSV